MLNSLHLVLCVLSCVTHGVVGRIFPTQTPKTLAMKDTCAQPVPKTVPLPRQPVPKTVPVLRRSLYPRQSPCRDPKMQHPLHDVRRQTYSSLDVDPWLVNDMSKLELSELSVHRNVKDMFATPWLEGRRLEGCLYPAETMTMMA